MSADRDANEMKAASVFVALAVFAWLFANCAPINDLASLDQEVRDQAAAEMRAIFQGTPETTWTPLVDNVKKGQTKNEIHTAREPFWTFG